MTTKYAYINVCRYELDLCRYSFAVENEIEVTRLFKPENHAELLALIEQHDENGSLYLEGEERAETEEWQEADCFGLDLNITFDP